MSGASSSPQSELFPKRYHATEKRMPSIPHRNVDTIFRAIWRQNYLQPRAIDKRLKRLEAVCVRILTELECWDSDSSDIIISRYFAHRSASQSDTPQGLVSHRVMDAAHCLHAARMLQKQIHDKKASAAEVAPVAMMIEGCATRLGLEPILARVSKFQRRQSPAEAAKQIFSSFLYLIIHQASMDGAIEQSTEREEYEMAASEGADSEVYKPRSKHAFRQQVSKWRKSGLLG